MNLPVTNPKTIDDLNKNVEYIAKFIIGKEIAKGTSDVTQTSTDTAAGTDATLIEAIKVDIANIITQLNLLTNNIKGQ